MYGRRDDAIRRNLPQQQAYGGNIRHRVHRADFMEVDFFHGDAVDAGFRFRDQAVNGENIRPYRLRNTQMGNKAGYIMETVMGVIMVIMVIMMIMIVPIVIMDVIMIVGIIMIMIVVIMGVIMIVIVAIMGMIVIMDVGMIMLIWRRMAVVVMSSVETFLLDTVYRYGHMGALNAALFHRFRVKRHAGNVDSIQGA